jgi:endonuclease I
MALRYILLILGISFTNTALAGEPLSFSQAKKQRRLLESWNQANPVDSWERKRYEIIQ